MSKMLRVHTKYPGGSGGRRPLWTGQQNGGMQTEVQYRGFVYIKSQKESERSPGLAEVRKASALLEKPKKAQQIHPLFCRGFDTALYMTVSEEGIMVTVPSDGEDLVVMDHPMHKVVFVVAVKKMVYVVAKHNLRGKGVMFKCHGFHTKSSELAKALGQDIGVTCNRVFKKLRQTRSFVRAQEPTPQPTVSAEGVPLRNKTDNDTRALKKILAQTRISVIQGNDATDDVSDEAADEAERMLCGPEPEESSPDLSTLDEIIRQLQKSIDAIQLEATTDEPAPEPEPEMFEDPEEVAPQLIDYDEFSDDFARMTLYLHADSIRKRPMPKYAEVTLDSELFDLSSEV
eukprot:m.50916 g.50916  ORF g.50916 m.50916 type:complete len:344 (-) comp12577_c0_seq1:461-1492(-)